MARLLRLFIVIAGCLYYNLVAVTGNAVCKGTEKTLKCTAFDGVKRESFHDLQWKVRSGVSNWERIAFCNHKLNCTTTDDISNWTAFFAVNDVTNGSLTIKFLEEADLTFMCEVHKEDHGTPHNQETLRVERCYRTQANVTACVGQRKVLKCDPAVQRVEPRNFEDLQWNVDRKDRWENLSYCNRTFFCDVSSQANLSQYRVKNTSLVVLNVENDGMKKYACKVLKQDHTTEEWHMVGVIPVECPTRSPSPSPDPNSSRPPTPSASGSAPSEVPSNASTPWSTAGNTTRPVPRSTADRPVSRGMVLYASLVILGLWCLIDKRG